MKTVTFAVSKGGVGKSLITANVGAALAKKGNRVILVEGDPNHPLEVILGINISSKNFKLEDVVKKNMKIEKAVYSTELDNLFLVPSGVSLQSYFKIDPINFAKKLASLHSDFMFIDVPFPLGEAAFLSLGICDYSIIILTEDEFVLCVESAIDTIRLGKYFFKCIPLGFVLNRIKTPEKFNKDFIKDLEDLLEIPCITKIKEDPDVSKSYGGVGSQKAFLAYQKHQESEFAKSIDEIATLLLSELPKTEKKDIITFIEELIKPSK
jgi:septum site-determining protein MinD